jgi:hypothetical protein
MFSSPIRKKADVLSSFILRNAGIAALVSTIARVLVPLNSTGRFNREDIGNVRKPVRSFKPDSWCVRVVLPLHFIMEVMNDDISRIYRQ